MTRLLILLLAACAGHPRVLELVESFPVETALDHRDIRDASAVWPEMIDGARSSIDFAEFYATEADPAHLAGSKLTAVTTAVMTAVTRGVRVRFLADASFAANYPELLARLGAAGVDVRTVDYGKLAGGVLHAKYFIVDGREAFVGSQNFDWRSLQHIQEMGVRIRSPEVAAALADVFETDWSGARVAHHPPRTVRDRDGARVDLVASPRGWLPDEASWDLPRLVARIDRAARAVDVQLLTYDTRSRDGSPFPTLDDALRRAAARGVAVRLLVSEWGARAAHRPALDALAAVPNVAVRVLTIPPWSGGDIPFARVAHAKYAVFDGGAGAWLGTGNWEGDYFLRSRNVGLLVEGGGLPPQLRRVFEDGWAAAQTPR